MSWSLRIVTAAGSLLLVACPGTIDDFSPYRDMPTPADDGGAFEAGSACGDVPTQILVPNCAAAAGCHTSDMPAKGLDLTRAGLEARLAGKTSATCNTLIVDPADAASSLLFTQLGEHPACGLRMPVGDPLPKDAQDCILAWIGTLK